MQNEYMDIYYSVACKIGKNALLNLLEKSGYIHILF